jgi:deoxyribodipyrimidine photo-lyase
VSCGACVQACPTATLTEKSVIAAGQPDRTVKTTCAYCGVGCSFNAELKGNDVVRMVPDMSGGANEGHSCVKGRFAWGYASHRDRPDIPATSRLSPHLRFGEISARQALAAARHAVDSGKAPAKDVEKFAAELGWREFSYHLLFHNPDLAHKNFQARFDAFPWRKPVSAELTAWKTGRTGFPIVDAGMRELAATGFTSNRMRQIVASFLVHDLSCDWRAGAAWFESQLVDFDVSSNQGNWLYVSGRGTDPRVGRRFNPAKQTQDHDAQGRYRQVWLA